MSAFQTHTCALADDGKVWCWGENTYAELGDGTIVSRGNPVWVKLPRPAIDVSAGYAHSCAVLDDGTAYCWGAIDGARTIPTTDTVVNVPTEVSAPGFHFTKISCGADYTCALTTSATVACWGNTFKGQCGIDGEAIGLEQTPPVEIPSLDHVLEIQAGLSHTCALRSVTPTLECWGSNTNLDGDKIDGKLGPAAIKLTHSALPVPVELGPSISGMGVGYESTYALAGGYMYAWGSNSRKQLGTQDDMEWNPTPKQVMARPIVTVAPLTDVALIPRSSGSGACATMQDLKYGTPYFCWGTDRHGELGFGTMTTEPHQYAEATMLPSSAANMARGINHACVTVDVNAVTEIRCFGVFDVVGNGTTKDYATNQFEPKPVKWLRENAREFLTR